MPDDIDAPKPSAIPAEKVAPPAAAPAAATVMTLHDYCRFISRKGHNKSPELVNGFYAEAKLKGPLSGPLETMHAAFDAFAKAPVSKALPKKRS